MSLEVVAEGVETEQQRTHLIRLGFDAAQGYLIAPPLADKDVDAFLQQRRPLESSLASAADPNGSGVVSAGLVAQRTAPFTRQVPRR